jgi:uncharacterized protein
VHNSIFFLRFDGLIVLLKTVILAGALSVFLSTSALAKDGDFVAPVLRDAVNDDAGILNGSAKSMSEALLRGLRDSGGTHIAVWTTPSLYGLTIEEVAIKVADAWKIGQKGADNGVIVVVAPTDRQVRIEVGRGVEGDLTDAMSRRIINEVMIPAFKQKDYNGAVLQGLVAIIQVTDPKFDLESTLRQMGTGRVRRSSGSGGASNLSFLIIFILVLVMKFFSQFTGGPRGIRRSSHWGGGGFGGGGFGGGGFGGGGFGGGGGGFGGGGSSGKW